MFCFPVLKFALLIKSLHLIKPYSLFIKTRQVLHLIFNLSPFYQTITPIVFFLITVAHGILGATRLTAVRSDVVVLLVSILPHAKPLVRVSVSFRNPGTCIVV